MSSYVSADITSWLNQSLDVRYANSHRSYVEADAGVYKMDEAGRAGFVRFLASVQ